MEFTHDILGGVLLQDPLIALKKIEKIEEDDDCWRIGVIEISKHRSEYRPLLMGFSSGYTSTSRFRLMEYHFPDVGLHGLAVIFRAFDRPDPTIPYYVENPDEYVDEPDELFAGWFLLESKLDAEAWVYELNQHIAKMFEHEVQERAAHPVKKTGESWEKWIK